MELIYFHKNLSPKEEETFVDYVGKKRSAIESLLTKFSADGSILQVSIEKFEKHDAYEVEFNLSIPTKNIVAKEASHTITKAIDLAKDRLILQLKKHVEMLRRDRSHKSIRTKEETAELVEAYEMENVI